MTNRLVLNGDLYPKDWQRMHGRSSLGQAYSCWSVNSGLYGETGGQLPCNLELEIDMASTEEWVEWARTAALPYWRTDHQMFLEVAMACCRHYRDQGGMSTVPELANAEHYWFMRWWCFASGGAGGDIAASPVEVLSPSLAQVVGRIASNLTMAGIGLGTMQLAGVWDRIKRLLFAVGHEGLIPGGDAPASRPSDIQLLWALKGYCDALALDAPYMHQMRWQFVMSELPNGFMAPPPLH